MAKLRFAVPIKHRIFDQDLQMIRIRHKKQSTSWFHFIIDSSALFESLPDLIEDASFQRPQNPPQTATRQQPVPRTPVDNLIASSSHFADVALPTEAICSRCLRITMPIVLEVSNDLIAAKASAGSAEPISVLADHLYSYLGDRIKAIKNRTSLSSEIIANGISLLLQETYTTWSALMQSLVHNCAIELTLQILDEAEECSDAVNGVSLDWYRDIPERNELIWMLPSYFAARLAIHRLTELGTAAEDGYEMAFEQVSKQGDIQSIVASITPVLVKSWQRAENSSNYNHGCVYN